MVQTIRAMIKQREQEHVKVANLVNKRHEELAELQKSLAELNQMVRFSPL